MTYTAFLAALRATPRDWQIAMNGRIRRGLPAQCPISACAQMDARDAEDAADVIGLGWADRDRIVLAADDCGDLQVRSDLLHACGLEK